MSKARATFEPPVVRHSCHVRRPFEGETRPVAAADPQLVVMHERVENTDDFLDALIPALVADLMTRGVTDVLVVRALRADWMMGKFEMPHQLSVAEYRSARAERQHEFESVSFDSREALHFRIIDHSHRRIAQAIAQHRREWHVARVSQEPDHSIGACQGLPMRSPADGELSIQLIWCL
jgi:hypothetical protein